MSREVACLIVPDGFTYQCNVIKGLGSSVVNFFLCSRIFGSRKYESLKELRAGFCIQIQQ
jgi:hypothetical protein